MNSRNSKLEILRIISIIFIVLSHYVVHSGFNVHDLPLGINRAILEFCILGNIGTMLFVLISGYFLINSNKVKLKKIVHFILQVVFYSVFLYLFVIVINKEFFKIKDFILNLFPITFKRYWFATVYFIIYLFHPFINKFLNSLSRKEYINYLTISIFIFFVLSTITTMDYYGNEIIRFIILYSIGAYMSKYSDNYFYQKKNSIKNFILSSFLIMISIILFDYIGVKVHFFSSHSTYFLNIYSFLALLLSVSLFGCFSQMKPNSNKFINYISSLVFGIYLISDNKYLREIIWCNLLNNKNYFLSNYLIIHIIASILVISFICLFIEGVRKKIFEKTIFSWLDNITEKVQLKLEK